MSPQYKKKGVVGNLYTIEDCLKKVYIVKYTKARNSYAGRITLPQCMVGKRIKIIIETGV